MYAIVTTVPLQPGSAETVVALFKETNPAIVREQPDWREARMLLDRNANTVTVVAFWANPDSYRAMAASRSFRDVMQRFSAYFAGPPEVKVTEVVVEMTLESVSVQYATLTGDGSVIRT